MKKNSLVYKTIKEKLKAEIKLLKQDDRLPSRTKLVEKYGVTRTTIERAISELIGEGLLYSKDGSGTYVSEQAANINSSNKNLGVILPNIMYDTYPGIIRGIEDIANENGINVVLCNTDNNVEKQSNYIYKLIASNISGIIIVPAVSKKIDLEPYEKLQENGIPLVFCNRGIEGITAPRVVSNNFYGGYLATKHLVNRGYKKIAFISRPLYSVSNERYQGFMAALSEGGIGYNDDYAVFENSFEYNNPGYDSVKKMLLKHEPDAFFCFNDKIAQGVYHAVEEEGLKVGSEIGIVGYDNTSICESLPVKLTSVKFKNYEIGSIAAEIFLSILKEEDVEKNKTVILQPELVVRESCGRSAD